MNQLKTYAAAGTALLLLAACQPKSGQDTAATASADSTAVRILSGTIVDATMNTLTLRTLAGDTVNMATVDAERSGSLLIGDSVEVACEERQKEEATVLHALRLTAWPAPERLLGMWVEPTGIENIPYQGLKLDSAGVASSINMRTLTYQNWKLRHGQLILTSISEGSGAPILGTDTFRIVRLSADSLILENRLSTLRYGRKK